MIQKSAPSFAEALEEAARRAFPLLPPGLEWAVIPATGPAELIGRLDDRARIDGEELAPGRLGPTLLWGTWRGKPLLVADPPPAPWEEESAHRTLFLYRLLAALGVKKAVLTTACASLAPEILPAGRVGRVRDHLDFSGANPLRRCGEAARGAPLFPDLTRAYDPELRRMEGVRPCPELLLAAVPGPSLPTPAEYAFYRNCGAEAAAMRGPQEVVAAVQAGLRVLLLAAVTQEIRLPSPEPADLERMMAAAEEAAPRVVELLLELFEEKR